MRRRAVEAADRDAITGKALMGELPLRS